MKKYLISLILLTLILINSSAFAISEQEATKYVDKNVFIVITYTTSAGLYGKIIDVIEIEGDWYIILDTNYKSGRQLMFLQTKNISYIRVKKDYE